MCRKIHRKLNKKHGTLIIICIWCLILYGGISRNARLAHLGSIVMPGSDYQYIPDVLKHSPVENLKKSLENYNKK